MLQIMFGHCKLLKKDNIITKDGKILKEFDKSFK